MSLVEVSGTGSVATLTLNRPEVRNALSVDLCNQIVAALDEIDASDARVVVIKGAGRVFCAGADIAAVSGPGAADFLPAFEGMLEAVARHRLPTVAAIHGAALGGGLQLATVCDFRIATTDARIGIPSARLGILVNFENVQRLVLLVGLARAKEILMAGRTFTGEEAAVHGLATRAVAPDQLEIEAQRYAEEVAALAPLSVQGVKRSIQIVADALGDARTASPGAVEEIDRLVATVYASEDLSEGLKAVGEKRPPRFEGR